MKLTSLFLAAVLPHIIAVETDNTSWIFSANDNGAVYQVHYGAKMDANEFAAVQPKAWARYSIGEQAFPATGGRYLREPALHVQYADGSHNTELVYKGHSVKEISGVKTTVISLEDPVTKLAVNLIYEAYAKEDVIISRAEIKNGGNKSVKLLQAASGALSLKSREYLLSHVNGAWAQEMQLESEVLTHGRKVLESRRGTQNTQTGQPSFVLSLDSGELQEDYGEVIAGTLAWSGNYRLSFELDPDGTLNVIPGINPHASAYPLAEGESFITPDMIWTWSGQGAGQASRNLHRWGRKYGIRGGGKVNPIILNSWEGAYFTFNTHTLLRMIDDAASMGIEMFVLDDGWFGNKFPRNGDDAGLGDWQVNKSKLPEGIDYIAQYAHSKGLKFGIWTEPEMVNPKSELAGKHPDWVVKSAGREIPEERNQWVLDLSNPAVQDFVYDTFCSIIELSPAIDYIKWDCNRPVFSFGSTYLGKDQDKFYIDYTQGLYKVMARIRSKYPDVLIQCCSSGGARVDYGAMRYFNEFWGSDNTDALERIFIQYGTSLWYPSCAVGSHVSTVPNHQNGNVTPLKFRFDVACQGRLGLELQPKYLSDEEKALVDRCVASYKTYRDLVFTGDLYRIGSPYGNSYYGSMYVNESKTRAVVYLYNIRYFAQGGEGVPFRLKGLDRDRKYKVTELNTDSSCWWGNGQSFSGAFLGSGAFNPSMGHLYSSAIFLLEAD